MGNWFDTGFTQAKDIARKRSEGLYENGLQRFWVQVGGDRKIIFLDDFSLKQSIGGMEVDTVPFGFWEHQLKIDGNWKDPVFATCTGEGCLPCEKKFKRQHVGAMTILDISPYTDKEGKTVVKPWKKLMVAVTDALLIIEAKKNKKGNLKGCVYSVARHDKRHPRVGSDFEFEERIEDMKAKYPDLNLSPYGYSTEKTLDWYKELFKPLTREHVEKLFASHQVDDGFTKFGGPSSGGSGGGSATPPGASKVGTEEGKDDDGKLVEY